MRFFQNNPIKHYYTTTLLLLRVATQDTGLWL